MGVMVERNNGGAMDGVSSVCSEVAGIGVDCLLFVFVFFRNSIYVEWVSSSVRHYLFQSPSLKGVY